VIEYKRKAELNRQTLIWKKAWYSLECVNCCILSANTEDKTLKEKWNAIIEHVKGFLKVSEKEVETYVNENKVKNNLLLTQVKDDIHQQVKDQHQIVTAKIK